MTAKSKQSYSEMTGRELYEQRKGLMLSQDKFCEMLGLSKRMYCGYERGENPIPRTVELAVRHLSVDIARVPDEPSSGTPVGTPVAPLPVLADFDKQRIARLADKLFEYTNPDMRDAGIYRAVDQAVKELDFLLEKFEVLPTSK